MAVRSDGNVLLCYLRNIQQFGLMGRLHMNGDSILNSVELLLDLKSNITRFPRKTKLGRLDPFVEKASTLSLLGLL